MLGRLQSSKRVLFAFKKIKHNASQKRHDMGVRRSVVILPSGESFNSQSKGLRGILCFPTKQLAKKTKCLSVTYAVFNQPQRNLFLEFLDVFDTKDIFSLFCLCERQLLCKCVSCDGERIFFGKHKIRCHEITSKRELCYVNLSLT